MPDAEGRLITDGSADTALELAVSTLWFADGRALDNADLVATILPPPAKAARGRQGDELLFLFDPTGTGTPDLCREVREVVTEVYWSTVGSVTTALRRAASITNHYLFEHNLNSEPSRRCYGGLACAVLRDEDLFLLQAGPAWACILQAGKLQCFPDEEKLAHLGIGPVADVRLHHVFAAIGDTLLLASPALLRAAGRDGLLRVLPRDEVGGVVAGLRQLGADVDFAALLARWERAPRVVESERREPRRVNRSGIPSPVPKVSSRPRGLREPVQPGQPVSQERAVKSGFGVGEESPDRTPKARRSALGLDVRRKLKGGLHYVIRGLGQVWHLVAAVGAGMGALGKWLIGAAGTTVRGMLPGAERKTYRRVGRRPPPEENRTVLIAVAVGVPVLVIGVVVAAHLMFAAESRFHGVMEQAEEHIALAQAAGVDSGDARAHWERALQRIETAATLQPNDASAPALREQAQGALDQLDRIQRLTLTQLADFGSSNVERRLVFSDQALFVLDSRDGWGARVPLHRTDTGAESENVVVLVRTGQQIGGEEVDRLVDCAWADREGGRQSGALLVLEEDGGLMSYDPAWGSESGAPQLTRLELSASEPGRPVAAGTYEGQFYVLDGAENGGQIWRYRPQGNAYPQPPEPYFATPPDRGLDDAVDMAIDGHIYVLYGDGTVEKFLGGERQQFEIQGVPGGIGEIAGLAVDRRGSGAVYVADRSNDRIVELYPDGRFKAQLLAEEAFGALEALAVSEAERRLYVLDEGRLYAASLP